MVASGITQGDPNKLDLTGGTMTGQLILPGDPQFSLSAVTKQYVDTELADAIAALNFVEDDDARLTDTRVPTDASVTNAKVASNAAIDLSKLAETSTLKLMTSTERTKLSGIAESATANSTDAQLRDRSTHTGTQSADTLTDGTTNKAFLATERTKLAGIATGATANDTDANLRARSSHTGTQLASTISDFAEQAGRGVWNAEDHGLITWTYDPSAAGSQEALVNGVQHLVQVILRRSTLVTNIVYRVAGAGVTVTANQNFVGLINAAGTLLDSINQVTNFGSTGVKTAALTTPQTLAAGKYWIVFLGNAGTPVQLARSASTNTAGLNVGLSAATYRFACAAGTGKTALDSTITPASNTLTNAANYWAALS